MNGQQRRHAIVEAAMPLFAKNGFAATTTRDLARAAGVSEALLYRHFPSKESLYAEIKGFGSTGHDPELVRLLKLKPGTPTLILMVHAMMLRFILGQGGGKVNWETRVRLMMHSCLEDGSFMKFIFRNAFAPAMKLVEQSIQAGERAGHYVATPATRHNRLMLAHHVAVMIGCMHLPEEPGVDYDGTQEDLLLQAEWFVLRGLGLKEKVIMEHLNMEKLNQALQEALG